MKANRAFMEPAPKMSMAGLGAMAIGILVLIVAYTIIPIVGEELDGAVTLGAASNWNGSYNSNIVEAYELWESVGGILKVAAIILVVAGFLKTLRDMKGA